MASCIFCQIARSETSTKLLHSDEKVVAFQDINPSAYRHYLVIPVDHIASVRDLWRRTTNYALAIYANCETNYTAQRCTTVEIKVRFSPATIQYCRPSSLALFGASIHTKLEASKILVSVAIWWIHRS